MCVVAPFAATGDPPHLPLVAVYVDVLRKGHLAKGHAAPLLAHKGPSCLPLP